MKITFIGGGNMATALIGGLIARGFAAQDLQVVELTEDSRLRLTVRFGVRAVETADAQALDCDVLVLAVKPQQMREALTPMVGRIDRQIVVSIAAGLRIGDVSRWLGGHAKLVRAMPNTPALIGKGVTGLYADPSVMPTERAGVERLMGAVGSCVWLDDEAQLDAVTALSGSGPAYVFYFIEALQAGGEALGLDAATARVLAIDTFVGAAALAAGSEESPAVLRARVTSKGGTTEAALKSMAADSVAAAIGRALKAAAERGRELGEQLGADASGANR